MRATLYDDTARAAADAVIRAYSTSFGLATRLLGPRVRGHVRTVYALVRVADEIVDGAAEEAGLPPADQRAALDALEAETLAAMSSGFSANLVVHAFAQVARECGIRSDLVQPFFASMRTDLERADHDAASHDAYVYGSAEVVGLMCLQVFVNAGRPDAAIPAPEHLVTGARRLGAAFQDVNFLRDLSDDADRLGRIDSDLTAAAATIPRLPADCRAAVWAAHDLFASLAHRLRASDDPMTRVRVPAPAKAGIAVRAAAKARLEGRA
jgi:15-cis-phytoene synthase